VETFLNALSDLLVGLFLALVSVAFAVRMVLNKRQEMWDKRHAARMESLRERHRHRMDDLEKRHEARLEYLEALRRVRLAEHRLAQAPDQPARPRDLSSPEQQAPPTPAKRASP
jgi:hypothetical protein